MSNSAEWGWTIGVALAAGVTSLYFGVKKAAVRILRERGAFEAIDTDSAAKIKDAQPALEKKDGNALKDINADYHRKETAIIKNSPASTFPGAWNVLSTGQKVKHLAFSAAISVAAGLFTRDIIKPVYRTRTSWSDFLLLDLLVDAGGLFL